MRTSYPLYVLHASIRGLWSVLVRPALGVFACEPVAVTDSNKAAYVQGKVVEVLVERRRPQLEAVKKGFEEVDLRQYLQVGAEKFRNKFRKIPQKKLTKRKFPKISEKTAAAAQERTLCETLFIALRIAGVHLHGPDAAGVRGGALGRAHGDRVARVQPPRLALAQ
eukprot:1196291-Prorocentrum_minimum.AAC.6